MVVARSAPRGAHYYADVIYLLPLLGIKKGARALWYSELGPTPARFPTNSLYTPMDNTTVYSIPRLCHPWRGLLSDGV